MSTKWYIFFSFLDEIFILQNCFNRLQSNVKRSHVVISMARKEKKIDSNNEGEIQIYEKER